MLRALIGGGAASLGLIALWPALAWAVGLSAVLQGAFVMMMSAVLSVWSDRLFPALPSASFTAALVAMAAGSVVGPVLAGIAIEGAGPQYGFGGAALLVLAVVIGLRPTAIRERAEQVEA